MQTNRFFGKGKYRTCLQEPQTKFVIFVAAQIGIETAYPVEKFGRNGEIAAKQIIVAKAVAGLVHL